MISRILFVLFLLYSSICFGESIKIGIFQNLKLNSVEVQIVQGSYLLQFDDGVNLILNKGSKFQIIKSNTSVKVVFNAKNFISDRIVLNTQSKNSEFKVIKSKIHRTFEDNLIVKSKRGSLLMINEINLDKYVAGVVNAEVGDHRPYEYYKVQAIISRTYALSNNFKHNVDGFHLCDQVHCQVYHGKPLTNDSIQMAALETTNYVLTDHNINLITTAFHSNCGGQTVNSDKVWSKSLPYLYGVKDPFCLEMHNSNWEKKISKSEWDKYLKKHPAYIPARNDDILDSADQTILPKPIGIHSFKSDLYSNEIRKDWDLKSASFEVVESGNYVILKGRGFGHGIGLCQEGAISMSKLGFTYSEIIHFYYNDVHLIDLNHLDFFKE